MVIATVDAQTKNTSMKTQLLRKKDLTFLSLFFAIAFLFTSCEKDDVPSSFTTSNLDVTFYGLTGDNKLLRMNAKNGSSILNTATISGLSSGARIMSIDFRPATGQLYGLGSDSRLYVINPETGSSIAIGSAAFLPAINGGIASIDFNPTVDRIRLVTNAGQNLRLHPETGAIAAIDGNISTPSGFVPAVVGIAYTNSKAGASTTTLYDIGLNANRLYVQNPPNDGVVNEVMPNAFEIPSTGQVGFDINGNNSVALASFNAPGVGFSKLFSIDLSSGQANFVVDLSATIIDLAIPTEPVAYAVSETNSLMIFNPATPQTVITKAITGLSGGENILGIDFRPVNGQLYALGSTSKLYTINLSSGAATAVGAAFTPALSGASFGFDFNPTVDRIRVVSNTGQNLRLNPNDGTVAATDGALNGAATTATAAAYTNNFAGATTTVLYVMDATKLYTQNPPNNGTLVNVGNLGITIDASNGFDISSKTGTAWAILTVGTTTKLYSINLTTGAATAVGDFGAKARGFAIGSGF
jgi:hypothetical protein